MEPFGNGRAALATVLALTMGVVACDTRSEGGVEPDFAVETGWERTSFDVYSQNLYLGGNTGALFDPAVLADLEALTDAVASFWDDVLASDVTARMAEIADEIALQNPEVVGVQEALQFIAVDAATGAPLAFVDLLATLEAQIAARSLPYEVIVEQSGTSSQLPLELTDGAPSKALVFTDRIAILRRTDVAIVDADSAKYSWSVPVAPGVDIERGWARLTVNHEGTIHYFVNTHLESQRLRPINEGQGFELLGILNGLQGVTVVVGDLNSDAAAMEGDPSYTDTYGNFLAAGFADLWELAPRSRTDPGYTCCQADDLRNATSELDERIDFVLVRSSAGPIPGDDSRRGHFRLDVVGDQPSDMTASGLWPSDHAGLSGSIIRADAVAD